MIDLIPASVRPYLLLIKIGLITAAAVGIYFYARHAGVMDERQEWQAKVSQARQARIEDYESQIRDAKAKLAKQEAASADLGKKVTDLQGRTETLQKALSRAQLVKHEPNPVAGEPTIVRLAPALRLCINAAALGTERAVADCQAFGVPAAPTP